MIDNVNIHSNLREWQNKIGYVSQNVFILDDTLKNNIVFGEKDDEINFKLLEKAIAQSQLSDFVSSLAEESTQMLVREALKFQEGKDKE